MNWASLLAILPLFFAHCFAAAKAVENFRLLDANGESYELYRNKGARAVVLFVDSLGCPIVEKAIGPFNEIAQEYKSKGIAFFMIDPRSIDSREELIKRNTEFKNSVPVLMDPTQVVARSLEFTRTAEVLVLDPETWTIFYRGPMDDGSKGYGTARVEPQSEFLKQTLNAILENQTSKIPKSAAPMGCLVNLGKDKTPSYSKDVTPVLIKRCIQCHDGRNPRAWKMSGYEVIKQWSPMIRESVMTRTMPPWWPDAKDGDLAGEAGALSDREQSILFNWIEAGSPRGKGQDPLETWRPKDAEGKPDLIAKLEHPVEVPAKGIMELQFVKLNLDTSKDLYVRGIRALTQTGIFHHMSAILVPPEAEQAGKPGESFRRSRDLRDLMYLDWIRRVDHSFLEAPYAFKIPKGYSVYLELHLLTSGRPVTFNPTYGLTLAHGKPEKIRVLQHMNARTLNINIPAGNANVPVRIETPAFKNPTEVVALRPHMHLRSKSMKVTAVLPDGAKKMILSVPDLKPHLTRSYMLKKPMLLPAGSKLLIEGAYDNSAQNPFNPDPFHDVKFGPHYLHDEMFICHVFYYDKKSAESYNPAAKWKSNLQKPVDSAPTSM